MTWRRTCRSHILLTLPLVVAWYISSSLLVEALIIPSSISHHDGIAKLQKQIIGHSSAQQKLSIEFDEQKGTKTFNLRNRKFSWSFRKHRYKWNRALFMIVVGLGVLPGTSLSLEAAASKLTNKPLQIKWAALQVFLVGGVGLRVLGLTSLSRDIIKASMRCALQLFLVGAIILQRLFGTSKPAIVFAWILGVGFIAANEAYSRVEYTYPKLRRHVIYSVLSGGLSALLISMLGGVFGTLDPWFQPRTLVPVAGMLFGNTLTAASLCSASLLSMYALEKNSIELRLARGASWREAAFPCIRKALSAALTPSINALSAAGVVHMPGMMTGQILAGKSPYKASSYQVMILLLIASSACTMTLVMSSLINREMFDTKTDRLRSADFLTRRKINNVPTEVNPSMKNSKSKLSLVRDFLFSFCGIKFSNLVQSQMNENRKEEATTTPSIQYTSVEQERTDNCTDQILKASDFLIERPNLSVSFDLCEGDRIGISGKSGSGKTEMLRAIAALEPWYNTKQQPQLKGFQEDTDFFSHWRRQVCFVPQYCPSVEGTPNDFYQEVMSYKSQRKEIALRMALLKQAPPHPVEIAKSWNVAPSLFDRPWSTLSGGEAQRLSLAIALATVLNSSKPSVLLLDESMGALDKDTSILVENTLRKSLIPILLVSHSSEQLDRFCNGRIEL